MFLNVASVVTFSVTHRSISSTKKKIDFFKTFLPDILLTTKQHTDKLFREFWGTQYNYK
jgi:hypothetical protein